MLPFLWSLGWCLRWSDATRAPLKLSAWNFPLKISNIPYTIYKHVEYSIYFMADRPLSQLLWFLFFFFVICIYHMKCSGPTQRIGKWSVGGFPGCRRGVVLIKSDQTNILNIHILFCKFQLIGKVIRANIVYELSYLNQSRTRLYKHRVYDM